jgi:hypothetical protein
MREIATSPLGSRLNTRLLWTGATLLALGASLVLVAAEWFAAFDACLANPLCTEPSGVADLEGILGLLVLGVCLSVGGLVALAVGLLRPARFDHLRTPSP